MVVVSVDTLELVTSVVPAGRGKPGNVSHYFVSTNIPDVLKYYKQENKIGKSKDI